MLYIYLWGLGYLIIAGIFSKSPKLFAKGLTFYTALLIPLFLTELLLIISHGKETSSERLDTGYMSFYDSSRQSWYHTWEPNKSHWITKREYSYIRNTNSLGYSDVEWPLPKVNHEKRILALGDSFTEGDGAPFDSCYVTLLHNKLLREDSTTYIMNAGICGCDPFINFISFRDKLCAYNPDIIIQTLSSGDMNSDIIIRGGLERFKKDGTVQFNKGPYWEPIYALSYLSRYFYSAVGYNQLLLTDKSINDSKEHLDHQILDLFKNYNDFALSKNCKIIIVLQPFKYEVDNGKYEYDFTAIIKELNKMGNIQICDLMPFYISYIKARNASSSHYYWPIDGHHNANGYEMMAEGIYPFVTKQ